MKVTTRLLVTTLVAALAVPAVCLAAKGERKRDKKAPAATFATADKNNDGTVTQSEFVAAMKEQLGEEGAKSRFTTLDKDANGKLSKEEFEASSSDDGKKKRRNKKNQD
jgi:Ca2+-binding EF-hand superfamily protein